MSLRTISHMEAISTMSLEAQLGGMIFLAFDLERELIATEAKLYEAKKDTARLDWIQKYAPITLYDEGQEMYLAEIAGDCNFRAEIDREMEARK